MFWLSAFSLVEQHSKSCICGMPARYQALLYWTLTSPYVLLCLVYTYCLNMISAPFTLKMVPIWMMNYIAPPFKPQNNPMKQILSWGEKQGIDCWVGQV